MHSQKHNETVKHNKNIRSYIKTQILYLETELTHTC